MKRIVFLLAVFVIIHNVTNAQHIEYKRLEAFFEQKLYHSEKIPKKQLPFAQNAAKQTLMLATYSYFEEVFQYDPLLRVWHIETEKLPPYLRNFDWEGVTNPNFRWRSKNLTDKEYREKYVTLSISWLIEYMKINK